MSREGRKPDPLVWTHVLITETTALKEALERLDWSSLERLAAAK